MSNVSIIVPVYINTQSLFLITKRCLDGLFKTSYPAKKEMIDDYWKVSPRYVLQKVGTECLRNNFDKDVWVKSLQNKILKCSGRIVVPDVRFLNEAKMIKDLGGFLLRVDRNGARADAGIVGHASENELKNFNDWDFVINNDSGFDNLYNQMDYILTFYNIEKKNE